MYKLTYLSDLVPGDVFIFKRSLEVVLSKYNQDFFSSDVTFMSPGEKTIFTLISKVPKQNDGCEYVFLSQTLWSLWSLRSYVEVFI
jgi:hypothetical protein